MASDSLEATFKAESGLDSAFVEGVCFQRFSHRKACERCSSDPSPAPAFGIDDSGRFLCRWCIQGTLDSDLAKCRERYWIGEIGDRVEACCRVLQNPEVGGLFRAFTAAESERRDGSAVVRRIEVHCGFFISLDRSFESSPENTISRLLRECPQEILDRSAPYLSFLKRCRYPVPARTQIADLKVLRRAGQLLEEGLTKQQREILKAYEIDLLQRDLLPRTLHRKLSMAKAFVKYLDGRVPSRALVTAYLQAAPTHRMGIKSVLRARFLDRKI